MFKEPIKKIVSLVVGAVGAYLVAYGIVPAETWASVSPDLIAAVCGAVGVVVAGVWNRAFGWFMGMME